MLLSFVLALAIISSLFYLLKVIKHQKQLAEVKNSEAFKSVVQQGEETTSKVVEAAKNKIKEKQKAEKDKDLHEV